jgi:tryptophanyl-tRNA synthetase
MQETKLDPWGSSRIEDYDKLYSAFGISHFNPLLKRIPSPMRYMRRNIIFGHRDYERVLDAILGQKKFAVMSGFMPSGEVHLGHKMVMEEIIWHQERGGSAHFAVADMEAHSVRGVSWKDCKKIGDDYILSLIALGFKPSGRIYFQSKDSDVKDLAFELGSEVNFSEMSAIYGLTNEAHVSHMLSAVVQSADILAPQLEKFGGPKPVVIPVGADQDPHIRLTRDIAARARKLTVNSREDHIRIDVKTKDDIDAMKDIERKFKKNKTGLHELHLDIYGAKYEEVAEVADKAEIKIGGYAFTPPSSLYHRFMSGLTGGKMSSSVPESYIALTEPPNDAAAKVRKAKTGGRATAGEQKKLGGIPEECVVYELMLFHLIEDDNEIGDIHRDCKGGKMTCNSCKEHAANLVFKFLKEHQDARKDAERRLREYGIKRE